jgi:hypothetical protein
MLGLTRHHQLAAAQGRTPRQLNGGKAGDQGVSGEEDVDYSVALRRMLNALQVVRYGREHRSFVQRHY